MNTKHLQEYLQPLYDAYSNVTKPFIAIFVHWQKTKMYETKS